LFHHLSALQKVPSVKEVLLVGFYEESVFRDFLKAAAEQFPKYSIKYLRLPSQLIRYLREYQALGTAGGLYLFRDAILNGEPKTIIVMHADVCCSFPLAEMLRMHTENNAIGTMLGTKVPPHRANVYSDCRGRSLQLRLYCLRSNYTSGTALRRETVIVHFRHNKLWCLRLRHLSLRLHPRGHEQGTPTLMRD
jgi:NDP-sugar pyrophosphorylase family protein